MAKAKLIKKGTKKPVKPAKKAKQGVTLQQDVQRKMAERATAQSQGRSMWNKLFGG